MPTPISLSKYELDALQAVEDLVRAGAAARARAAYPDYLTAYPAPVRRDSVDAISHKRQHAQKRFHASVDGKPVLKSWETVSLPLSAEQIHVAVWMITVARRTLVAMESPAATESRAFESLRRALEAALGSPTFQLDQVGT